MRSHSQLTSMGGMLGKMFDTDRGQGEGNYLTQFDVMRGGGGH